jgi:hypothetical protein
VRTAHFAAKSLSVVQYFCEIFILFGADCCCRVEPQIFDEQVSSISGGCGLGHVRSSRGGARQQSFASRNADAVACQASVDNVLCSVVRRRCNPSSCALPGSWLVGALKLREILLRECVMMLHD